MTRDATFRTERLTSLNSETTRMAAGDSESPLGYLSLVQPRESVFVGGLLLTTRRGRPLEFHCTTPVSANETQRVLYGRTLPGYLCGDVIASALLKKASGRPGLIFLDDDAALDAREHSGCPVAVLLDDGLAPAATLAEPADSAERGTTTRSAADFDLGPLRLRVHSGYLEDVGQIRSLDLDPDFDLGEPLQRVREALGQTVRGEAA